MKNNYKKKLSLAENILKREKIINQKLEFEVNLVVS